MQQKKKEKKSHIFQALVSCYFKQDTNGIIAVFARHCLEIHLFIYLLLITEMV